jgi:hypothetical protein
MGVIFAPGSTDGPFSQIGLKPRSIRAEMSHVAHEPTSPERVTPVVRGTDSSHDAFVVIGLVAVIIGAATGSLAIALAVFAAPALALGGTLFLRSHL